MNCKYIIFKIVLILACSSCYKDKGNYALHDINELSIKRTGGGDTINVNQFDTLRVEPILTQSLAENEQDLSFEWSAYLYPVPSGNIELGFQRNLKSYVLMQPGTYKLKLKVTDKKTGIPHIKEFLLLINGKLSEGWLVLEENEIGDKEVSIIKSDETIRNLFNLGNIGRKLPKTTHTIRVGSLVSNRQFLALLGKEEALEVNPYSFQVTTTFKDWFVSPPKRYDIQNYYFTKFGVNAYLVNDGEIFYQDLLSCCTPKFGAAITGNWKIAKFSFVQDALSTAFFYDTKNQRFLKMVSGNVTEFGNPEGSAFEMNNIKKELVYGGTGIGDHYNCLFRDPQSAALSVYRISVTAAIPAVDKYDVKTAPALSDALFFASSGLNLHLYYAKDNKVYLLDIPAKTSRLVYTFSTSEKVTAFELKQAQGRLVNYPDNNKTLAVATYGPEKGKLYTFSINNTGDFVNNTFSREVKGFNKVIDLEYKNRT